LINFVDATNDANHYTKPPSSGRRVSAKDFLPFSCIIFGTKSCVNTQGVKSDVHVS